MIHPDMADAAQEYRRGDRDAFAKAAKIHQEKAKRGEKFHNDDHDIEMSQTARQRTDNEIIAGNKWPKRKPRTR